MLEKMNADDSRFRITPENVVVLGEERWRRVVEHTPYSSCRDNLGARGQTGAEKFDRAG